MKTRNILGILTAMLIIAVGYLVAQYVSLDAGIATGGVLKVMALAGYTRVCFAKSGGIRRLYITEKDNVDSFTLVGEEYTAVTMTGGAVFYRYDFEQDSANYKPTTAFENMSKKVTHDIELKLDYLLEASRLEIEALADASHCGLIAIIEDNNANMWVVGYSEKFLKDRPLRLLTAEGDTGKAFTDANGDTLKFQSTDANRARKFTGTIPETIVGP